MENKTAAVSLRNVTKTFGPVIANDKINLDIYKGEILALRSTAVWPTPGTTALWVLS